MILTKDLECFKSFIADVEEAKVPFRILGYQQDEVPAVSIMDGIPRPPRKFIGRLLLCSSMTTVMYRGSLPIEEKPHFSEILKAYDVRLMNRLTLDESGLVTFASTDGEKMQRAIDWVKGLVEEPEVGKVYTGTVVGLKDFGAFINILPGVDGMLHVSKIAERRISSPDEVLKVGQKVRVKLTLIDDKGRLSLTMLGIKQDI